MHSISVGISAGLIALALLTAPDAEKADCGTVANRYTAAVAKVLDAVAGYAKCISASAQHDDCAAQMRVLDDAHDDFADAVADAKECR